MMYLSEISLISASLRQYIYKLKGYSSLGLGLIMVQILALIFSWGGTSQMGSSGTFWNVQISNYSGNIVIAFSFIWILIIAIKLTTKPYKIAGFTLVATRLSDNLSNIALLLTACVFGGITSSLSSALLRVVMYFASSHSQIAGEGFRIGYLDLLLSMSACFLYFVLIAAMGYLMGILVQLHIAFVILIPAAIFGFVRMYPHIAQAVAEFYGSENLFALFALKAGLTAILIFGLSMLISNRREVRE